MSGLDRRSNLEIHAGAALNEAEAVERIVDGVLTEYSADVSTRALRQLILARHNVYAARIIVDRVFRFIEKNELSPDAALDDLKNALKLIEPIDRIMLEVLPSEREQTITEEQQLERVSKLKGSVETVIRAIGIWRLEGKGAEPR